MAGFEILFYIQPRARPRVSDVGVVQPVARYIERLYSTGTPLISPRQYCHGEVLVAQVSSYIFHERSLSRAAQSYVADTYDRRAQSSRGYVTCLVCGNAKS